MKTYGKFEAVRELYETPTGSVWQARTFGTKGRLNCVIKLVQPEKFVFAATSARLTKASVGPAESLLISAALQQNLANRSEFWAPIYHMGTDGKVAFYVTKAYDRSAQRLIETKTPVSSADLAAICSAVVNGLADLRDNYDRAHANLKPGNVLIGGNGKIDAQHVALSDPAMNGDPGPSLTRPPDTKALGEIIYGLVTSRPHSTARFPVQSSEEWDRLGRSGPQWLALCNDLLNTMATDGPMPLAQAQARLKELRPSRRKVSRKWLALAALIALAAAGYIYRQPIIDTAKTQYSAIKTRFTPAKPVAKKSRSTTKPTVVESTPTTVAVAMTPPPKIETAIVQTPSPPTSLPTVAQPPTLPPIPKIDLALENDRRSFADRASQSAPPDFLPPKAQSAYQNLRDGFVEKIRKSADPVNDSQQWTKTNARIMALDPLYPKPEPYTDQPWQAALHELQLTRRETALVAAVQHSDDAPAGLPMDRVNSLSKSLAAAQAAVEQGEAILHADAIQDAEKQIANFTDDAPVLTIIKPAADELAAIAPVWSADDDGLLAIAKDSARPMMTRVVAWQRLDVADKAWPATAEQFSQDRSLYKSFRAGLVSADSPAVKPLDAIAVARSNRFFNNLTADALPAALRWQNDNSDILPADRCPAWFQFDLALFRLKNEPSVQPGDSSVQALLKSATAVSGNSEVAQLVQALSAPAGNDAAATTLDTAGPAASGWRIRQRAGGDRWIVYLSGSRVLEFLRVESSDAAPAFYLSTTEVPIGLVKELLAADAKAAQMFKSLNPVDTTVDAPGVTAWDFLPGSAGIELDEDGFKKYLRVPPSEDMPIQRVTPQGASFLAKQIGCRLPSAAEWQSALKQAENSTDAETRGFATLGWKLRDRNYTRLRLDPLIWPDDHVFFGPDPSKITHHGASATVWNSADVEKMNGELVTDTPDYKAVGNLAFLTANSSPAFRGVGNSLHVFHDLVGNIAEFVTIDNNEIAVVGGSALSPPELDPMTPAKLPTDTKSPSFADVGFRLAFSDPKSRDNSLQSAIRMARYVTAPSSK